MGKGDIKTRKGKISTGSYGVRRPQDKPNVIIKAKPSKVESETPKVDMP